MAGLVIDYDGNEILKLVVNSDEFSRLVTVRQYLCEMLSRCLSGEDFSMKRLMGKSGWKFDLYQALGEASAIHCAWDDDGYIKDFDHARADRLLDLAVEALEGDV